MGGDDGFGLSVWGKRVLELPVLTIGSRRPARHRLCDMNSNENDEPYEVVVKHDSGALSTTSTTPRERVVAFGADYLTEENSDKRA